MQIALILLQTCVFETRKELRPRWMTWPNHTRSKSSHMIAYVFTKFAVSAEFEELAEDQRSSQSARGSESKF